MLCDYIIFDCKLVVMVFVYVCDEKLDRGEVLLVVVIMILLVQNILQRLKPSTPCIGHINIQPYFH